MKTYDSVILGRYIVSLAFSMGKILNMTKLQKLLYILYGYYRSNRSHAIVGEHPQAWPFGPVFPRVHKHVDPTAPVAIDSPIFSEIKEDIELNNILKAIIEKYSKYTASQLSGWSHMSGGPWEKTTKSKDFKWSTVIPDEYITEYFSEKLIV